MKKIVFIALIIFIATPSYSQEAKIFTGNYRSVMGVMNSLSCYCYNGGYLTYGENEKLKICFDEMKITKVRNAFITVKGHFEEITHESTPMDPCPEGTEQIFVVESYKIAPKIIKKNRNTKIIEYSYDDYLLLESVEGEEAKYVDKKGKTVLLADEYLMCFTDTFRNYALVLDSENGFVSINRKREILYHLFVYDNGPDYVKEGLFRIIKDDKIGYADSKTGKVVVEPIYQAANPFENGKAKVALLAKKIKNGEHYTWQSNHWIFIDKWGREVK